MTKTRKAVLIGIAITSILGFVINRVYTYHIESLIENAPRKFVYSLHGGSRNSALVIESKDEIPKLKRYYQNLDSGKLDARINFQLLGHSPNIQAYVIDYYEDSTIVEIISFDPISGAKNGGYFRGYAYYNTLHDHPANYPMYGNKEADSFNVYFSKECNYNSKHTLSTLFINKDSLYVCDKFGTCRGNKIEIVNDTVFMINSNQKNISAQFFLGVKSDTLVSIAENKITLLMPDYLIMDQNGILQFVRPHPFSTE